MDVVVVGGGAIGCAIARALCKRRVAAMVLEKNAHCGFETSSRSSEVLHAGIYYNKDDLRTTLCIRGRERLAQYMKERGIDFQICTKLIVSTHPSEDEKLIQLMEKGKNHGLDRLELLSGETALALEPELHCSSAVLSPYSGIFDSHSVLQSFVTDIEESNGYGTVLTGCEFFGASRDGNGQFIVDTNRGQVKCKALILAAGLHSWHAASKVDGFHTQTLPHPHFAKGRYMKLSGSSQQQPFNRLIYPLPVTGGLGVHATIDLTGRVRFGPDVVWLPPVKNASQPIVVDYSISEEEETQMKTSFKQDIARYWPKVTDSQLVADYAALRPKLSGPGQPNADFMILHGKQETGLESCTALFGIESPGWTAAMALAEHVATLVEMQLKQDSK
jgi:L-2-hydroxyglutarate oxidase LhgO